VGETDLQVVSAAKWLDKYACDDRQERGGCCGGWAVCGGRVVWVGNNDEWSRFGRTLVAVWEGGGGNLRNLFRIIKRKHMFMKVDIIRRP
jgi:hypothetical protein